MIDKYKLDLRQELEENKILNEEHLVGTTKVFIARAGAFYKETLKLTQNGVALEENVHYKPLIFNRAATSESGKECYMGWVLLAEISPDNLFAEYHAVGGKHGRYTDQILDYIEQMGLETGGIHLKDIQGVPDVFPPGPHKTEGKDIVGLSELESILASMTDAIMTGRGREIDSVKRLANTKVPISGNIALKPQGGVLRFSDTEPALAVGIPRSNTEDAIVAVEVTMVAQGVPYNGTISYTEAPDGVIRVSGYYLGALPPTLPVEVGTAVGSGNVTVLRFGNPNAPRVFDAVFIKSLSTTDLDVENDKYIKLVEPVITPSMPVDNLALTMVSSGATAGLVTELRELVAKLEALSGENTDAIRSLANTVGNDTSF